MQLSETIWATIIQAVGTFVAAFAAVAFAAWQWRQQRRSEVRQEEEQQRSEIDLRERQLLLDLAERQGDLVRLLQEQLTRMPEGEEGHEELSGRLDEEERVYQQFIRANIEGTKLRTQGNQRLQDLLRQPPAS